MSENRGVHGMKKWWENKSGQKKTTGNDKKWYFVRKRVFAKARRRWRKVGRGGAAGTEMEIEIKMKKEMRGNGGRRIGEGWKRRSGKPDGGEKGNGRRWDSGFSQRFLAVARPQMRSQL